MRNFYNSSFVFFAIWQASLFSSLTLIQGMHILPIVMRVYCLFKKMKARFYKYIYMIGSFPHIQIKALAIIPSLGRVCYLAVIGLGPAFLKTSSF